MEILTGNELLSGAAVYLDADGNWVAEIDRARLFAKDEAEARDAAIAASKATGRIVGVEIETVKMVDGRVVADRIRERIRAEGPTAPAFPRQELGEDGHVSI
ncbi:DUF2849 domain-containing protein [Arsenicitalea aurantiaca]|uniref:DUF2849 domain-containing protein n=1 Tax=Arsenicitalea aurantiaca TaxID=1783274 RepID=A0A433XGB4_9HYPH|nr:DUF2849 domain-containing protein [Arsenicitalea aurantiaca]RUT33149.1 DUF2849 domain-containing protein [Arsenicitalea aurantiaca]